MNDYCPKCSGKGEGRVPSSNPEYHHTRTCEECDGVGLLINHACTSFCDPEDQPHLRLRKARIRLIREKQEINKQLKEEIVELKKEFERKRAQLITISDQQWELAKEKVEIIEEVRNKLVSGIPLTDVETRTVFFALSLVAGEARLRRAGY